MGGPEGERRNVDFFKVEKVFTRGLFILRIFDERTKDLVGSANWTEADVVGGDALTCGCLVGGRPQALWDAFDDVQKVCAEALKPYVKETVHRMFH